MTPQSLIFLLVYAAIITVLVWARLQFFPVDSQQAKRSRFLYDPVVAVHIAGTFYSIFFNPSLTWAMVTFAFLGYILGVGLFLYAIQFSNRFSFAGSDRLDSIVTTGPYNWVRHPLYVSYFIIWLTSTIVFNSLILWITLLYLTSFYIAAAKLEERHLKVSEYSREYKNYCQNVGMFIPRIKKWKN